MSTNSNAETTTSGPRWLDGKKGGPPAAALGLVIAWSSDEPARVGEVALLGAGDGPRVLGRGPASPTDPFARVRFGRQRPEGFERTGPLAGRKLSRIQLRLEPKGEGIDVHNLGRCPMAISGASANEGRLAAGDTLLLESALLLVCVRRPDMLARHVGDHKHPFGQADPDGFVGESPAAWRVRDQIAFVAQQDGHVLVLGESGSGKELAARAIHARSRLSRRAFVARNAATLPRGVIDAELFGHAKDFPNAGMPERVGLLGEAEGGVLFLDEIGEIEHDLQAHLLRLLDGGEYQRLGDPRARRANIRIVAATNRAEADLKHDLAARLSLHVHLPGLGDRVEDVPLLTRQLLLAAARKNPRLGERFLEGWDGTRGEPRVDPMLVEALVRRRYTHHVRELESILWHALSSSPSNYVALSSELRQNLAPAQASSADDPLSPARIQEALDRHGGNQSRAYRDLGLSSRDALYRLMRKNGIAPRGR